MSPLPDPAAGAISSVQVRRWHRGEGMVTREDELAREEPLEIRVENQAISVTMRTPGNDEELAAGFLLSEGLVARREQIREIRPYPRNEEGNVINVFLGENVAVDFKRLTRHVFASSSCGLCGKASIENIRAQFPPIDSSLKVDPDLLAHLPAQLQEAQSTFQRTGGLHASALFDAAGSLQVVREDVGRHNALDKVLGWAFLSGRWPLPDSVLLVSGRTSFEIVQKALAGGIPVVAAISAPSSLAVAFARESGITLVGFLRGETMNVYTHPERLQPPG